MGFYKIITHLLRLMATICGMIGLTILPLFFAYSQTAPSQQHQEQTTDPIQTHERSDTTPLQTPNTDADNESSSSQDEKQLQEGVVSSDESTLLTTPSEGKKETIDQPDENDFAQVQPQTEPNGNQPEIIERDGMYYPKGDNTPFTGVLERRRRDGLPRLEERYENGRIIRMRQWHPNGKLAEETAVSGDTWTLRLWNEAGILEQETLVVVKDKKKVSESSKLWHENGQLKLEIHFAGEKLDGVVREYAEDGTLLKHEIYSQGKLIQKIK